MLILCTAFYKEALPFINHLQLKKDTQFTKFQLFRNEKVLLLITGTGKMNSAIALTSLCSLSPPSEEDLLVNIGICGCTNKTVPQGTIFLCNKILEAETRRTFFPDMLYSHPFLEGCLLTSPVPVDFSETAKTLNTFKNSDPGIEKAFMLSMKNLLITGNYLVDMEAAGLYQAASYFFKPHQMLFLKVVSDHLVLNTSSSAGINPHEVSKLLESNCDKILEWVFHVEESSTANKPPHLSPEEETAVRTLFSALRLSVTMEHSLLQHLRYFKLREGSILPVTTDFLKEMPALCKTKLEGKKYFDKFKQRLL